MSNLLRRTVLTFGVGVALLLIEGMFTPADKKPHGLAEPQAPGASAASSAKAGEPASAPADERDPSASGDA
jgi:hypothetical protein